MYSQKTHVHSAVDRVAQVLAQNHFYYINLWVGVQNASVIHIILCHNYINLWVGVQNASVIHHSYHVNLLTKLFNGRGSPSKSPLLSFNNHMGQLDFCLFLLTNENEHQVLGLGGRTCAR